MKQIIIIIFILFSLKGFSQEGKSNQVNIVLSTNQLLEDFKLYVDVLKETHSGLYRYTTEKEFQHLFDSIQNIIKKPLSKVEFYKLIARCSAQIQCAHSYVIPDTDINTYFNSGVKTLPFFFYPIDGKVYVLLNGSQNQEIKPGYELLQINNHKIEGIANILKKYYWVDGKSIAPKDRVLKGNAFRLFYNLFIENTERYQLTFRDLEGQSVTYEIFGMENKNINKNYNTNAVNAQILSYYGKENKKKWGLKFLDTANQTALLSISEFGEKGINTPEKARKVFRKFMDKTMSQIKKEGSENLVVDLRNNTGGWDIMGLELLSYLVKSDTSFTYYKKLITVTKDSEYLKYSDLTKDILANVSDFLNEEKDGTFSLKKDETITLGKHLPKKKRFRGNIFILMNKQSASSASEFLAVAKSFGIGTLIGTEAGGAFDGGNGYSFIKMTLPNSGITFNTPLVRYMLNVSDIQDKSIGTIPHYTVKMKIQDLLNNHDRQLEFVKSLIEDLNNTK